MILVGFMILDLGPLILHSAALQKPSYLEWYASNPCVRYGLRSMFI